MNRLDPAYSTIGHRWRSCLVLGAALAAVSVLGASLTAAASAPTRPIDRNIESYVIFARTDFEMKGAQAANPENGFILGGDIGVNEKSADDTQPELRMCSSPGFLTQLSDGSQVVADSVRSTDGCSYWDVYTNDPSGNPPMTIRNSGPNAASFPILQPDQLPAFPAFSCNPDAAVHLTANTVATLPPGTYGNIDVDDGVDLTLQAGTYTFCDWNTGRNVHITNTDQTVLQIERSMTTNNDLVMGPSCKMQTYVRSDGLSDTQISVSFGRQSTVHGRFWVPNGRINLGDDTDLFGKFWADQIRADANVNVTDCGRVDSTTPTTTTDPSTTTTTAPSTTTTTAPSTTTTAPSTTTTAPSATTTTAPSPSTTTEPSTSTTTTTTGAPVSSTTVLPSSITTVSPTSTSGGTGGQSGTLARTGTNLWRPALVGIVSIFGGIGLVLLARRRRAV